MTATTEFVVPKSIPMILDIAGSLKQRLTPQTAQNSHSLQQAYNYRTRKAATQADRKGRENNSLHHTAGIPRFCDCHRDSPFACGNGTFEADQNYCAKKVL
jgi:hypothetical protein